MKVTFQEPKKIKSLDEYLVSLMTGMLSLKTLENFHIRAVEIGILPEDLNCRCNTIVWDIRRMIKLYQDQTEAVLELLPEFDNLALIETLKEMESKKNENTKRIKLRRKKKD